MELSKTNQSHLLSLAKLFFILLLALLTYQALPLNFTGALVTSPSTFGTGGSASGFTPPPISPLFCTGTSYTQGSCSSGQVCSPTFHCIPALKFITQPCTTNIDCYSGNCNSATHQCRTGTKIAEQTLALYTT